MERARPSVVVALLTPFGNDSGLDVGTRGEHVEFLLEAGVAGVRPCELGDTPIAIAERAG